MVVPNSLFKLAFAFLMINPLTVAANAVDPNAFTNSCKQLQKNLAQPGISKTELRKLSRLSRSGLNLLKYTELKDQHAALSTLERKRGAALLLKNQDYLNFIARVISAYGALNDVEGAEQVAHKYLAHKSTSVAGRSVLLTALGSVYITKGRFSDALGLYQAATRKPTNHASSSLSMLAPAHYWLSLAAYRAGKWKLLKVHLETIERMVNNSQDESIKTLQQQLNALAGSTNSQLLPLSFTEQDSEFVQKQLQSFTF